MFKKEKEKLDKAVARNVRERLARQIAKKKVAMDKEAIGGLLGGLVGAGLGAGKARSLGMPTTRMPQRASHERACSSAPEFCTTC